MLEGAKRCRLLISVLGIATATCLAVGCGSSNGSFGSAALSKPEYIERAEAICTKINREAEAAATAWKKEFPGGAAEAEKHPDDGLRKVLIPALEREADQLEALVPPTGHEAVVASFVENLSQANKALREQGFKALPRSGAIDFKREAAAYGLKSCGKVL